METEDRDRYERAKKRVEEIKGFYVHLTVYLLVNAGLLILNLLTSPGEYWFRWPLFGWGIGLVVHGLSVFAFGRFLGPQWEERKIREIMGRDGGGPTS
jgi:hypothetical protein